MTKNKKFYLAPLKGYQYISRLFPANCRYYPTCSEYAKWQFELNSPHLAFIQSGLRILRCNQLFDGGIDYPLIPYKRPNLLMLSHKIIDVNYWLIPKDNRMFYVIKDYKRY